MKNKIYNLKTVIIGCFALLIIGCQKDFELNLPLAVDTNAITLPITSGSTHVMVYSTGDWKVSFAEQTYWASIDKASGSGIGNFIFTYTANAGLARSTTLILEKGDLREEIVMLQNAGETDPTLVLEQANAMLIKDGITVNLKLLSNLHNDIGRAIAEVIYGDVQNVDWISDIEFTTEYLRFKVSDNLSGADRLATVKLSVKDAYGTTYATSVTVAQSQQSASLQFTDLKSYAIAPEGERLDIPLTTNLSSLYDITPSIKYDGTSIDWLNSYTIDDKGLHIVVPANRDVVRSASLKLTYTQKDGSQISTSPIELSQDKSAELISFAALRAKVSGTTNIDDNIFINGVIISDCKSMNMELNPNKDYASVDRTLNDKTAYIQSIDGKYGFRIQFEDAADNTLLRYSKVSLSLRKTTLMREDNPERYTISGVKASHIISTSVGTSADLPVKSKFISELTPDDIYTFVSLQQTEFVFKDGSYADVYETYVQKSAFNSFGNNRGDGWASLIADAQCSSIYMLVNTLCPWRRTGAGVAQGIGTTNGIIVHTQMPRYGNIPTTYSIRPVDEADIAIAKAEASSFHTIVEWNWNDAQPSLNFEKAGTTATATSNDRVLADIGTGFLSSSTNAKMTYSADYNDVVIGNKGLCSAKGIVCTVNANQWWNWDEDRGNSFLFEFSTTALNGTALVLNFTFAAGSINIAKSYDFPVYWQVEYSIDGKIFTKVDQPNIILRTLPWWDGKVAGVAYTTSYEAGLGHTQHMVVLPASLLAKPSVTLRLSPANKTIATLDQQNTASKTLTQTTTTATDIRFGMVSIKYK